MLNVQLDNAIGDNKKGFVFAFCLLLMYHGVFQKVFINFLIVGHMHNDIDALFGRWSYKLRGTDYPTLLLLMKSFIDTKSRPIIPHFIAEVPKFKKFVDPLIMWMLKHTRGGTPSVVKFGMKIRGLIPFGPTQIVPWVHGNLGFEKGL